MSLALEAMTFAREVHRNQRRKYTGDMRTTPPEVVRGMTSLYVVGLRVDDISRMTGIPAYTVRNYVANHGLQRDEALFEHGVKCIAVGDEEFRRVPWAPWYYVSDLGRVLGMSPAKPGTIVNPAVGENGYLTVKLVEADGVARHNYVHRTVLTVFRGDPGEGQEGAHGDGDKANNRLKNLRWATHKENVADKELHGTVLRGPRHPNYKAELHDTRV